jgi:serine/threonine-protein kinase
MTIPADLVEALVYRYRLVRELGQGGMATVYLAQDLRHDRPVAIKVLRPELSAQLGAARFERETKIAARLQHPHILTVHDSGIAAGQLWYAMPYVEGASLRDHLRSRGQLAIEDAVRITREVADALDYAHCEGIVHRDIKPENILLSRGHALVADFGIARALHNSDAAQLTGTGMSVGTPAYMSPEQSMGDPRLDGRSDLYSLACVLYEMLVGEAPYTGPSAQVIIAKRLRDPIPSARALRETVPVYLDAALQRALAKAPADRFATVGEFSRTLEAGQGPAGITQTVTTPVNALPRTVSDRARTGTRLALVAVLACIVAAALLLMWPRRDAPGSVVSAGEHEPVRIAVLPFENIGDTADAYFADGVADAVRGKLTELRGLEVIARASSVSYAKSRAGPADIAHELSVRYLLTGTVRWAKSPGAGSRVQVAPELVAIRDNDVPATEWSQRFDASLTDVFEVQGEIAGRVAEALGLRLGITDSQQLAAPLTNDIAAYDAYLRAEAFARELEAGNFASGDSAIWHYRQAVARDSTFAQAWAGLAGMQSVNFINSGRPAGGARPIHDVLSRVQRLAPGAPETAYLAAQVAYNVDADTTKAFAIMRGALRRFPGVARIVQFAGVLENQVGRFDAALAYAKRGLELDPRSTTLAYMAAFTALMARRYDEARPLIDRAEQLQPRNPEYMAMRAASYLGQGKLEDARRVVAGGFHRLPVEDFSRAVMTWVGDAWVLDSAQRQAILGMPTELFNGSATLRALTFSDIKNLQGDSAAAREWADSAIFGAAEDARRWQGKHPGVPVGRGLAEARLGRRKAAVASVTEGLRLSEADRIGFLDPYVRLLAARAMVEAGQPAKAIALIDEVLRTQYMVSAAWLALDPAFAPLRGEPAFDRLVPNPQEE